MVKLFGETEGQVLLTDEIMTEQKKISSDLNARQEDKKTGDRRERWAEDYDRY